MENITFFWIFAAVVLALVEAATMGLVSIWFCIGAVVAAVVSVFVPSMIVQFAVFLVVSAVILAATRPIAKRINQKGIIPTNADRIIGNDAIVILDINPIDNSGQIKTGGQIWSAKSLNGNIIEKDTIVTVTSIEGVRAVVKIKKEES